MLKADLRPGRGGGGGCRHESADSDSFVSLESPSSPDMREAGAECPRSVGRRCSRRTSSHPAPHVTGTEG